MGFLVLFDPPKPNIVATIASLKSLGVSLKIITGDNRLVAASVSQQMGLSGIKILAGPDLRRLSDGALLNRVGDVDVFAEIEPNQKERIILALKKAGNVVGYMGDGINDASALHAADVGISVDSAVDVAKEAADIVLLEKDLGVLVQGVREGRTTFANTLKYVFMATSANFGNMFSMAGASLFLPYLPLLPAQILLTNLMTDFPEMTIATDSVDSEMVDHPRRWDIVAIRKFMITFGLVSSVFDFLTFGALLLILQATQDQFRRVTPVVGWVEPPFELTPDPIEVADIFEVPLSFVLDPANQQRHFRMLGTARRDFWAIPYRERYIWGATATMLLILDRTLRDYHR